ncbi:MAG TPA: HAMP domain-containing sensor histidine kinase [Anaerolineaceae bacterium]
MKRSLKSKLILSYLAVALITILVVSVFIRLTSGQSLNDLVVEQQTAMLKESAQTYYAEKGSLEGFFEYYLYSSRQAPAPGASAANQPPPPDNPGKPPKGRNPRGIYGLVDSQKRAVFPLYGFEIGQTVPDDRLKQAIPVEVDGKIIAWILPDTGNQVKLSAEEQQFLQRTNLALALAALAGMLIAISMGFFLASRLVKPIRRLTQASQALSRGELRQEVPVTSQDELGQLTQTFNQMSADLARADEQRKRLTADITHDLSTPLQVISGYVEMLEDGEVPLTPQRIEIIKTEIGHLRRLVADLGILTQVEASQLDIHLQPVKPEALLERIYHAYQPIAARQGVTLTMQTTENIPQILVDEGRMLQVMKNLVDNALRYTRQGNNILLSASVNSRVVLRVSDDGTGIDPEDLPYIFDRFFQVDKSRGEIPGKMGLGLAICKALVTAQGGWITAESPGKGKGTTIIITFDPLAPNQL